MEEKSSITAPRPLVRPSCCSQRGERGRGNPARITSSQKGKKKKRGRGKGSASNSGKKKRKEEKGFTVSHFTRKEKGGRAVLTAAKSKKERKLLFSRYLHRKRGKKGTTFFRKKRGGGNEVKGSLSTSVDKGKKTPLYSSSLLTVSRIAPFWTTGGKEGQKYHSYQN